MDTYAQQAEQGVFVNQAGPGGEGVPRLHDASLSQMQLSMIQKHLRLTSERLFQTQKLIVCLLCPLCSPCDWDNGTNYQNYFLLHSLDTGSRAIAVGQIPKAAFLAFRS